MKRGKKDLMTEASPEFVDTVLDFVDAWATTQRVTQGLASKRSHLASPLQRSVSEIYCVDGRGRRSQTCLVRLATNRDHKPCVHFLHTNNVFLQQVIQELKGDEEIKAELMRNGKHHLVEITYDPK